MKWIQAKVVFDFKDRELATELISDIFYSLDLQGVVVESTEPDPDADWADGVQNIPEVDSVSGYFARNIQYEEKIAGLEAGLARLQEDAGIKTRLAYIEVDEEDWAESWKEYFWPEKISDGIVVKPTWRDYTPKNNEIIIEIDPGMAFGTGTHATTALCIRAIEKYLNPGESLLDVGTGSGILMIAAQKLGAGKLSGVDMDAVAVEVAEKNLRLNGVSPEHFVLKTGNLADVVHEKSDVVVANILTEVILVLLDDLHRVLRTGGLFIASGIIVEKRDRVVEKMTRLGFTVKEIMEKDGWVVIVARFRPAS